MYTRTNARRIDLMWGNGSFDVLLDLRTQQLLPYADVADAEIVHDRFGGKNYYRSGSGLSGAGWVPTSITLPKAATYRVDSVYVEGPSLAEGSVEYTLPGRSLVMVPIDYGKGIAEDWPVVVVAKHRPPVYYQEEPTQYAQGHWSRWDGLYMFDRYGLKRFLRGEVNELVEHEVVLRYIPASWLEPVERRFTVLTAGNELPHNARKALVGIFNSEIRFRTRMEEQSQYDGTSLFWTRLGLRWAGDHLYKISKNVSWGRYSREELSNGWALQAVAPTNVEVITPNLYIQPGDVGFDAVALFEFDGEEVDFEMRLTLDQAVRAMAGDYGAIQQALEAGAREKVERARARQRQQELWALEQSEREAKFAALLEQFAEVEIVMQDSLDAGNCEPGTRDFARRTFPGRESVTVKELVRFIENPRVRAVLEHKILSLKPLPVEGEVYESSSEASVQDTEE